MASITNQAPQGYIKKPKWIYGLGLAFLLAPFGNFLWSLAALGVRRWWDPAIWRIWVPYVEWYVWVLMLLVAISGLSLMLVRKWSWVLSLAALGSVFVYSVILLPNINSKASVAIVALLMLLTIGAMGVIFFSPFRLPYVNPRLRWWETSPRYRVDIKVKVGDVAQDATLVDISRSGALVEWTSAAVPELEPRTKITLPMGLTLLVEVIRKTQQGYGLKFLSEHNKADTKTLKTFLEQLSKDPTKLAR
ncbi:MAG TPA: PilZ domain-containing protein [Bdellovibrionota bacterium]|jgi:hypothetical protein|nr:PilZ domain-containing protein [Bdellovibrionota bacterium]